MAEQHGGWAETSPPPGWLPPSAAPAAPFPPSASPARPLPPSGSPSFPPTASPALAFPPSAPALPFPPPRPVYREPHPIRTAPLLTGLAAAALWFALFGSLGRDLFSYAWWTVAAAISAWFVAAFLTLVGDRGVAVGVALTSGLALSIAAGFVGARWITTNDWPLW
ncbi:hypothetical protein AB0J80_00170 [Actinoplanes sp. NPDC049548]|uniref:hypothetical protein n=1 Tax=Actinoplanes sp. NPDC049548 TaxID=3155152 RepID=UPI003429F47A